eukprot:6519201-Prymnesium_polylepis.1
MQRRIAARVALVDGCTRTKQELDAHVTSPRRCRMQRRADVLPRQVDGCARLQQHPNARQLARCTRSVQRRSAARILLMQQRLHRGRTRF